jgi:hypothetical protein
MNKLCEQYARVLFVTKLQPSPNSPAKFRENGLVRRCANSIPKPVGGFRFSRLGKARGAFPLIECEVFFDSDEHAM